MVARYAVVIDGVVQNITLWDGTARTEENPRAWSPPADAQMVALADGQRCQIGDVYAAGTFSASPPALRSAEEIAAELAAAVDDWIERTARGYGFGSALVPATVSLATYVNSSNDLWRRQALAFLAWRDAVWTRCIAIQLEVFAGIRAVPTADALIAELPPPVIPTT